MEGSSSLPGTTVSVARRRFKMLICAFLGILILCAIGTGGYFAYKEIQGCISDSVGRICTTTMLPNQRLIQSHKTLPTTSISIITQSTIPPNSEPATVSVKSQRQSQTLYNTTDSPSNTESRMLTPATETATSTISISTKDKVTADNTVSGSVIGTSMSLSTEQTAMGLKETKGSIETSTQTFAKQTTLIEVATSRLPLQCPTYSALLSNFSCFDSDPCISLSDICSNGSTTNYVPAYCECTADGIWTIIQKRFDGSIDFYRNWTEYKAGFGDLNGEFWLGNDAIHQMSSRANCSLKIYLTGWDNTTKYAVYEKFRIADEADGYRLTIGGYSGDAGDSMRYGHNEQMFSTKDVDNDPHEVHKLAEYFTGAWWYGPSTSSSLNGQYHYEAYVPGGNGGYGIIWAGYNGTTLYSMKQTKMLIKQN